MIERQRPRLKAKLKRIYDQALISPPCLNFNIIEVLVRRGGKILSSIFSSLEVSRIVGCLCRQVLVVFEAKKEPLLYVSGWKYYITFKNAPIAFLTFKTASSFVFP